jgi:signal transduction histidine kinase
LREQLTAVINDFSERFRKENRAGIGPIEDALVNTDPQSLQCILANLLENALKYTEPGGKVTISATLG